MQSLGNILRSIEYPDIVRKMEEDNKEVTTVPISIEEPTVEENVESTNEDTLMEPCITDAEIDVDEDLEILRESLKLHASMGDAFAERLFQSLDELEKLLSVDLSNVCNLNSKTDVKMKNNIQNIVQSTLPVLLSKIKRQNRQLSGIASDVCADDLTNVKKVHTTRILKCELSISEASFYNKRKREADKYETPEYNSLVKEMKRSEEEFDTEFSQQPWYVYKQENANQYALQRLEVEKQDRELASRRLDEAKKRYTQAQMSCEKSMRKLQDYKKHLDAFKGNWKSYCSYCAAQRAGETTVASTL